MLIRDWLIPGMNIAALLLVLFFVIRFIVRKIKLNYYKSLLPYSQISQVVVDLRSYYSQKYINQVIREHFSDKTNLQKALQAKREVKRSNG